MTVEEIVCNPEYQYHHTATAKGYVSRKIRGVIKPYKGKFGEGYRVYSPRYDTTQYCFVEYYIKVQ